MTSASLPNEDYTVGWICALPLEAAAATAMLDEIHEENIYTLGRICEHNVVIVSLPAGVSGTNPAATVAIQLLSNFPSIRFGLMVGIGGGVPSVKKDIQLGDVVVSKPEGRFNGVVQYDRGKTAEGKFECTGSLNKPPQVLLSAVSAMEKNHIMGENKIREFLEDMLRKYPKMQEEFSYPSTHDGHSSHDNPSESRDFQRLNYRSTDDPVVHFGLIASGNQVIKDAALRDQLRQELGGDVLCFEMEAAGLMDTFPCIVIRGISDYADHRKNDLWQGYAAATAAACAKELLGIIQSNRVAVMLTAADRLCPSRTGRFSVPFKWDAKYAGRGVIAEVEKRSKIQRHTALAGIGGAGTSQILHGAATILNELPAVSADVAPPTISAKVTTTYAELGATARGVTLVRDQLPELRPTLERLNPQSSGTDAAEEIRTKNTGPLSIYEKRAACLSSLAATDQNAHLSRIISNNKSSCGWIFRKKEFKSWNNGDAGSLLCIGARAGCGKTTIAAHIIQCFKEHKPALPEDRGPHEAQEQEQRVHIMLYFFFQRVNVEGEGTAVAALRAIVKQLIDQIPSLGKFLLWEYEVLSLRGNFSWSWDTLWNVLLEMLGHLHDIARVSMIFDAVDECDVGSRMLFLDSIRSLIGDRQMQTSSTPGPALKILITSRPNEQVSKALSQFLRIDISNEDTAEDMQALIHSSVDDFSASRHLGREISNSIRGFLQKNAQGLFLWVVLIMEELEKRDQRLTDESIVLKLSSVPITLANTYATILHDAPVSRRDDLWRVLRWLVFGKRALKIHELETVLCRETKVKKWHDFVGDIKFLCGSLIRVQGDEVHFIHDTAREFTFSFAQKARKEDLGGIDMDPLKAESHIAKICMKFLLDPEIQDTLKAVNDLIFTTSLSQYYADLIALLTGRSFFGYVAEYWAVHFQPLSDPEKDLRALTFEVFNSLTRRRALMGLVYFLRLSASRCQPCDGSGLHLASYFNLPWLVDEYLRHGCDPNIVAGNGDTPLAWASEMGSSECVKSLISARADPNRAEIDKWTPLHWAARNGHVRVAELLLEAGARADAQDEGGTYPIDWASGRCHREVTALLETIPLPPQRVVPFQPHRLYERHNPGPNIAIPYPEK